MTAAPNTDKLWPEVDIDPVRIAFPGSVVGYTLRAYRLTSQITPTQPTQPAADEDDPFEALELARSQSDAELSETIGGSEGQDHSDTSTGHDTMDSADDPAPAEWEPDAEDEPQAPDEDAPLFLSHRGQLLLFATPEALVEFVRSQQPHDMRQLDQWDIVVKRLQPEDIAPTDDDTYELDLVVENLRGGHDAWDLPLLISAGEIGRDLGHALRLQPVINALSPGSPLDDLDEALRATAAGGLGAMFARRRLRRMGAQQASLGWRTVIGKISNIVDWRD